MSDATTTGDGQMQRLVAEALLEPRIATLIGRRKRWFPLAGSFGCLECDGRRLTLYDKHSHVVVAGNVTDAQVRKLRLDAFRLTLDGGSFDLFGVDPSAIRRQNKRPKLVAYLDHHRTLDQVPGLTEADNADPRRHRTRKVLWAAMWVKLLQLRGATTS